MSNPEGRKSIPLTAAQQKIYDAFVKALPGITNREKIIDHNAAFFISSAIVGPTFCELIISPSINIHPFWYQLY